MTPRAYYNEFEPKTAAWLRELIKAGLIAQGDVDDRSICDVRPEDIRGYTQCHFFAGIGGWSYALRLAGIPDDYPVWTASLPCQPFSAAGKQLGKADDRHLLPHYIELVKQCRPATQFGEQVASAIKHGWACDLQAAMEAEGYAVGYHVLGAHSVGSRQVQNYGSQLLAVIEEELGAGPGTQFWQWWLDSGNYARFDCDGGGAPHQRQRLYWVAHSKRNQQSREKSCSRPIGRMGRIEQPVSWNRDWESALSDFRAMDDGLPRCVVGTDAARNAIVPQVAAEFIGAFYDLL